MLLFPLSPFPNGWAHRCDGGDDGDDILFTSISDGCCAPTGIFNDSCDVLTILPFDSIAVSVAGDDEDDDGIVLFEIPSVTSVSVAVGAGTGDDTNNVDECATRPSNSSPHVGVPSALPKIVDNARVLSQVTLLSLPSLTLRPSASVSSVVAIGLNRPSDDANDRDNVVTWFSDSCAHWGADDDDDDGGGDDDNPVARISDGCCTPYGMAGIFNTACVFIFETPPSDLFVGAVGAASGIVVLWHDSSDDDTDDDDAVV